MTRQHRVTFAKAAILMGMVPVLLWAYEYGPNPGYVGVPGENLGQTCANSGCHTGTTNDPKNSGSVAVTFASGTTYAPGVKQHLTVTISDPATTQKAWGFQLTARVATSVSTMAGTFASSDANTLLMCSVQPFEAIDPIQYNGSPQTCPSQYTLQYIEHSLTGFDASAIAGHGNGSYSYSFDWTPPSTSVGNITVYVAGNAGIGLPASQTGDHVYARTYTLTPATAGNTPQISSGGIVSAGAFGGFTAAAAGSWIEIYGSNLSSTSRSWAGSDFNGNVAPTQLDSVTVTINGTPAVIDYISSTQVNAYIPAGVGTGTAQVVLKNSSGTSNSYALTLNPTEPGLLAPGGVFAIGGKQYLVAQHGNGTFVAPSTDSSLGTPAKPGETLVIYGVGFGAAKDSSGNAIPFGQIVTASNTLSTPLTMNFGSAQATLSYYGLAPGYVGLYQFNVVVPTSTANNDALPVTFNLSGNTGSQTLYTAVHN